MSFHESVRRGLVVVLLGVGLVVLDATPGGAQEWTPAEGEVTVTIVAWDRFDESWPVIDVTPGYGVATPENENGNEDQLHAGPEPSVTVITAGEYQVLVAQEPQVRFLKGSIEYTVEVQWTDGDGTRHDPVELPGTLDFPAGGVQGSLSGDEAEVVGTLESTSTTATRG